MGNFIDLVGRKFCRLVVLERKENNKHNQIQWLCLCNCGNKKIITGNRLRTNHTKSCGCLNAENLKKSNKTHGLSGNKEYRSWASMKARCYNPNDGKYKNYGGRGISVCKRWMKFENFLADMGTKPTPSHQIDRKNTNGSYEPANCRWVTPKENSQNRLNSKFWVVNGKTFGSSCDAAKHFSVAHSTILTWCKRKQNCYSYSKYL